MLAVFTPPTPIHHEFAVQHRPGRDLLDHSGRDLGKVRREHISTPRSARIRRSSPAFQTPRLAPAKRRFHFTRAALPTAPRRVPGLPSPHPRPGWACTWTYRILVEIHECPSNFCTAIMSTPA
jgi:hypothetical protein